MTISEKTPIHVILKRAAEERTEAEFFKAIKLEKGEAEPCS